jgi:peptide deformylase
VEEHGEVREPEQLDAEAQVRRQMALSQIRQYPDSALRLRAREVTEFDAPLQQLVERMKSLMVDANGVGLAATQVGVLQRLFVFALADEDDVRALVNPRIVERGEDTAVDEEGCLSIQRVLVPVERNATVVVEGQDERGEAVRLELADADARVVQHEVDHLDGVLIIDRTTPEARREALGTLRAQLSLV